MNEENNKISVLLVQPGKYAQMIEVENTLEAMEELVGGDIEEYMPFEDEVAVVCNGEGKEQGLPPNRAIYVDSMKVGSGKPEIICGNFLVVKADLSSENYEGLPVDFAEKYRKKFQYPETFFPTPNGMKVVQVRPKAKEQER